jgi:hypothetical protein
MQQPSKFAPVLTVGNNDRTVFISNFEFNNLICCAGIIIGGASGTYFYKTA